MEYGMAKYGFTALLAGVRNEMAGVLLISVILLAGMIGLVRISIRMQQVRLRMSLRQYLILHRILLYIWHVR